MEFIINNYIIFLVAAIVLLLGLLGYIMDKKKYEKYRKEIVNEERAFTTLESQPDVSNVAAPVLVQNDVPTVSTENDPVSGEIQQ